MRKEVWKWTEICKERNDKGKGSDIPIHLVKEGGWWEDMRTQENKGVDRKARMDRTGRNKNNRNRKWERDEDSDLGEPSYLISGSKSSEARGKPGPTLFLPTRGSEKFLTLILL